MSFVYRCTLSKCCWSLAKTSEFDLLRLLREGCPHSSKTCRANTPRTSPNNCTLPVQTATVIGDLVPGGRSSSSHSSTGLAQQGNRLHVLVRGAYICLVDFEAGREERVDLGVKT
jgi:hypothetical protein